MEMTFEHLHEHIYYQLKHIYYQLKLFQKVLNAFGIHSFMSNLIECPMSENETGKDPKWDTDEGTGCYTPSQRLGPRGKLVTLQLQTRIGHD